MSTSLKELQPEFMDKAEKAFKAMKADGILRSLGVESIAVSETRRALAVQMAYYSRGRMRNEDVKAMYNAAGLYEPSAEECRTYNTWTLESKHLQGLAVDLVPVRNGGYWWKAPAEVWERMGEIGRSYGMKWGGDWRNRDCPHFEA